MRAMAETTPKCSLPTRVDGSASASLWCVAIAASSFGGSVYSFSGFTLDPDRREVRDPNGELVRLRPKAFELLRFFVTHQRHLLAKSELMDAVWPGIHVGEDSLFQAIREIRIALGDDDRRMVRLVSGRGYLFAVDVSAANSTEPEDGAPTPPQTSAGRASGNRRHGALAVLFLLLVVAIAAFFLHGNAFNSLPPSVSVRPIVHDAGDAKGTALSQGILAQLVAGLSKIDGIDLIEEGGPRTAGRQQAATYEIQGELRREEQSWHYQARLVDLASGRIESVAEISTDAAESSEQLLQTRLAARAGYAFADRLNSLQLKGQTARTPAGDVAIRQAIASINQTTQERFATALAILEKSLSADPDNVDLQVALAALHLRGVQMAWYDPAKSLEAEEDARVLLERALKARPNAVAILGAYCRFLTVTNQFSESLVACARVLTANPWDGTALFHLGMTHVQLGRFADALAVFSQADRFDTPEVSRWTWMLGAGWASLLMDRNEDAVTWLERSVAITPASGRAYMLLAAAYQNLGRTADAKNAFAKAMEIRPQSTVRNISLPARNTSDIYLRARQSINRTLAQLGLPNETP